jgi:predicted DNA-binding transcriptional regulator YafY
MAKRAKTFYIKSLKIFSHKDTIYLHARIAKYPGKPYKEPTFNPLMAIQRIKKLEITDRSFEFPTNYDFEKTFNENFGVIKEDAYEVAIEFSGFAARYVNERIWSPDQKITKKKGDKIKLAFTASSVSELISWILSFGAEAKVIKPDWLIEKVSGEIDNLQKLY